MNGIAERSYEPITPADLDRLAALAAADREARFGRRPRTTSGRVGQGRRLLVTLASLSTRWSGRAGSGSG
jgi:hypothetical protein